MTEPGPSSLRQPKAVYRNHNGFHQTVEIKMSSSVPPKFNFHAIAATQNTTASREELREFRDAVQRRQFVENMMELKGTFFPGLEEIRKANETPETSETLKTRIEGMKKKHLEEVRTLYQWHAQDYYDEMVDMSQSRGDYEHPDVEKFYRTARSSYDIANTFDDELDRHHYAYLNTILPLIRKHNELSRREAEEQKIRDQQFPGSIEEFHTLRKDIKVRIARFLAADENTRERTRTEFGWAYIKCKPLITQWLMNSTFKSEVQQLLQDVEARDPRIKP